MFITPIKISDIKKHEKSKDLSKIISNIPKGTYIKQEEIYGENDTLYWKVNKNE